MEATLCKARGAIRSQRADPPYSSQANPVRKHEFCMRIKSIIMRSLASHREEPELLLAFFRYVLETATHAGRDRQLSCSSSGFADRTR
jgi:hypothetical protein